MDISKKIKEIRINRFINSCRKDKLDYEVYYPKLYNISKFSKLIKKINRLNPEEKEYVLSPLKSMKYGLKEDEVYQIMKNQLDIVRKKQESNIVDLTKLYLATTKVYKGLYQELLEAYLTNKSIGKYQSKDYIDMFTENLFSFMLNQQTHNDVSIDGLAPNKLKQALKYNEYGAQFLNVYNSLSQEEKENINNMNEMEFQKILDFIFDDYDFHRRKNILIECGCISKKIDSLRLLPNYLIELFNFAPNNDVSSEKTAIDRRSNREFINHINNDSANWIAQLSATPEVHAQCIKKLIKNEKILNIPNENLEEIFKFARKNGKIDETNVDRYKLKINFLIGSHNTEEGFAFWTDDKEILKETLKFICQDDNEAVLKQKFSALNTIKNELINNQIDYKLYSKYILLLSENLENKSVKEKITQIKARSKYFEDHILSEFAEQLQKKPQKENLMKLIQCNQKPKKIAQNYRFISMSDNYNQKIVDIIIDFLAETEDVHYSKAVLSFIKSKKFKSLSPKKQKKQLIVLIDFLRNEKNKDKEKCPKFLKKKKNK